MRQTTVTATSVLCTLILLSGAFDLMGADLSNVTPREASQLLSRKEGAVLVDVRSQAEYQFVGHPPMAYNIPWMLWNAGTYRFEANKDFEKVLTGKFNTETPVLFICRSGGRSAAAARKAAELGYKEVYNVVEGFEGALSEKGGRTVNGWKNTGLPYTYAVDDRLKY